MKLVYSGKLGSFLVSAMLASAVSLAAAGHECASVSMADSAAGNASRQASDLVKVVERDAAQISNYADELQMATTNSNISWEMHAADLTGIKEAINDMAVQVCRLEAIRSAASPWEQRVIDTTAPEVRLMADNAGDAIHFLNGHHEELWRDAYRKYLDNLYQEANQISQSIHDNVRYAKAHQQEELLGSKLGIKKSS